MYKAYNLKVGFFDELNLYDYLNEGTNIFNKNSHKIKSTLDSFALKDGSLDGSKMQEDWFPQIKADVFISHSHKDENLAKCFAGWLKDCFDLDSFIDSCVWGYSNNLLKIIDEEFCKNTNAPTYNYNKRNGSTSHVHMMLSTALTMMLDKTECVFFLNTPNSITTDSVISRTYSPWIYHEIAMTKLIKENIPARHSMKKESLNEQFRRKAAELKFQYVLPVDHLIKIDVDTLLKWEQGCLFSLDSEKGDNLDDLYDISGGK
ncbi:MAG TPA: hypothetical protein PKG52_07655 [bacterium]|nr:hypothetical protein [bacterium]